MMEDIGINIKDKNILYQIHKNQETEIKLTLQYKQLECRKR